MRGMTTWAILSDVHGRADRLRRALADATKQGADRFLSLGDLGSTHALDLLDGVAAEYVFGNWEASGWRGMDQPWRGQVARWPAVSRGAELWAAHASPVWPPGLTIAGVVDYLRTREFHWTVLFPSLQRSADARWAALAELEAAAAPVFFHGHTHAQEAWLWRPDATLVRVTGPGFTLPTDGSRALVGVGSVGDPQDGGGVCYALYDDAARGVVWRRV